MSSQESSTRYPIVAIPKDLFQIMLNAIPVRDGVRTATVNSAIQEIFHQTFNVDNSIYPYYLCFQDSAGKYQLTSREQAIQRVRVTQEQYALLRVVQTQFRSYGHPVSISDILTGIIWSGSKYVRKHYPVNPLSFSDKVMPVTAFGLYVQGDTNQFGVVRSLFVEDGSWRYYTTQKELPSPVACGSWLLP